MADFTIREVVSSTAVNDKDQGALLTVALAFCTSCSFVFLIVRLIIRQPLSVLFGRDDAAAAFATLIGLVQSMVTLHAVSRGLGRRDEDLLEGEITEVNQSIFFADLLYILVIYLAKLAVVLFFMRLSSSKVHRAYCHTLAATCAIFCVVSIFVLSLQTPITEPWDAVLSSARLDRWIATEIMSGLVDLTIAGFPIILVKDLVMRKKMKVRIVSAIALRLILVPLAIARLATWPHDTPDRLDYIPTELYLQAEMCYTIISATIPCLGAFLQSASPGYLGGANYIDPTATALALGSAASGGRSGSTYKMSRLSNKRNKADDGSIRLTRKELGQSVTHASAVGERRLRSLESDGSERAIVVQHTIDVRFSEERM
ncbi:hypothetical protein LTR15_004415 [Elasticomyces elasticus]|nr:hypothetical protein LTR15_004415 [Elasticomyces elasticus]